MTAELFRADSYLRECTATVTAVSEHGITLDRTVFYPLGGGQGGDAGWVEFTSGPLTAQRLVVVDTRKASDAEGRPTTGIWHVAAPASHCPPTVGDAVIARIDWARRHRLMRLHSTTHLLCHLVPRLVNGCSITPDHARLDFHMTEPLDKDDLSAGIARLVAAAHPLHLGSVTDAELDANPTLVKSMSVQPPRGSGIVRTIRIGSAEASIDLQPCGGTHVANTAEIGDVRVTKIEKKSATTRRVVLGFGA